MSRFISVFVAMVFMLITISCSTHKVNTIGDYRQEINGISFHGQYEILYWVKTHDGKSLIATPFATDSNDYLPENTVKLHLGLKTINPLHEKFDIWLDWKLFNMDGDLILQKSKLVHMSQGLPEEFISINLPYMTNIHSKFETFVEVISNGEVRYSSSAKYKIREVKN